MSIDENNIPQELLYRKRCVRSSMMLPEMVCQIVLGLQPTCIAKSLVGSRIGKREFVILAYDV